MNKTFLHIRLTPGAKGGVGVRELTTLSGETIRAVRIPQKPVKGEANKALIQTLSKRLRIPQSQITLVSGTTSRNKKIQILSSVMDENQILEKVKSYCGS